MDYKEKSKNILKSIGVYDIFNNEGKHYIGSTKNLRRRFIEHFRDLKNNKHKNKKLQNYYNKHGDNSLEFCCLCENLNSIETARKEEKYLIDIEDTYKNGFNCTNQVLLNDSVPDEIRKIISDKAKLRQSTEEVKLNLSIQNSGTKNPNSKLSLDDIYYIRKNYKSISRRKNNSLELADKFNVNKITIFRIVNGKTYTK